MRRQDKTKPHGVFGRSGNGLKKTDAWLLNHKPKLIDHAKEREAKAKQKLEEMKQLMKGAEDGTL